MGGKDIWAKWVRAHWFQPTHTFKQHNRGRYNLTASIRATKSNLNNMSHPKNVPIDALQNHYARRGC
eukprot:2260231-Amphidinium_carterae.1